MDGIFDKKKALTFNKAGLGIFINIFITYAFVARQKIFQA